MYISTENIILNVKMRIVIKGIYSQRDNHSVRDYW